MLIRPHFQGEPDTFAWMLALFRGVPIHRTWWQRLFWWR